MSCPAASLGKSDADAGGYGHCGAGSDDDDDDGDGDDAEDDEDKDDNDNKAGIYDGGDGDNISTLTNAQGIPNDTTQARAQTP